MISIAGLQSALSSLGRLDLASVQRDALQQAAEQLQSVIQESLSHPPGSDHSTPWRQTGELQASIGHSADDAQAVIGSSNPSAAYQELGTRGAPPRPFLAPAAAEAAPSIADQIGEAVSKALSGALQ